VTELDRVLSFLRAADEGASTSVRRFPLGVAFVNEDLPRVHDRNFVLVTADAGDTSEIDAAADRLLGGAGLAHRKVAFEWESLGEAVAAQLGDEGWECRRLAIMAYRGGAAAPADEVSEVDRLALRPAVAALVRSEPWGADEEVVRQLSDADAALAQAVRQRCFARLVGGHVVSMCRLYSDGTTAQIEEVATLPSHRRRGHAQAVVTRAANEAAAGHDLVFLTVVDGRWVKQWYERLGFEQVGLRYEATRAA
jgi:ribosomal protein S18 acetylase RimI-like enzyme